MSPYEMLGREKKAHTIAAALESHGITADDAATGGDAEWAMAAKAAGTKAPSAETRRVVIEIMRQKQEAHSGK